MKSKDQAILEIFCEKIKNLIGLENFVVKFQEPNLLNYLKWLDQFAVLYMPTQMQKFSMTTQFSFDIFHI